MTKLQNAFEKWTQQLQNPTRRLQYFLVSVVLIYFVWAFLLINPQRATKKELDGRIHMLQSQLTDTKQQIETLQKTVKSDSVSKVLNKKNQLELNIKEVDAMLARAGFIFISTEDWLKLKKEIVHQQVDMDKNITFVRLNDLPVASWTPPLIDKADTAKMVREPLNQHELELIFQADYFSTIQYISRLEKMPWNVYWDSLSYKVLVYPKAEVTIKFHIFTHEKIEA